MTPELIDEYERSPARLRAATEGLTDAELKARPGPGGWSILEVVVHIADSDAIAIDRMKRMLIEDNPPLLYADETAYVEKLFTHDQSLEDALLLLEIGRRQFARVLRKLPPEAFARGGVNSKSGPKTVGGMVKGYIDHIDEHMPFIVGKREALGKPLAGAKT